MWECCWLLDYLVNHERLSWKLYNRLKFSYELLGTFQKNVKYLSKEFLHIIGGTNEKGINCYATSC